MFRSRGIKRCPGDGAERFELFVGAAVLANDLRIIAALLIKRSARRPKAT
jgi:transposase, IS5 family